jgi:hypothetical protein
VYDSYTGGLLWHLHIYIVPRFGSSPPLSFLFSHSSSWTDFNRFQCYISYMLHIHTCTESISIIFTLLYPLHLTFPSHYYSLFNITCFIFLSCIVLTCVHCSVGFCLGILPINTLYFNQSNPLCYSSLFFSPTLYCLTVFSTFWCVLFLHRCYVFQCYSLSFFSSFPSPLVSTNCPTFENMFFCICIWICLLHMRKKRKLFLSFWT